MLSSTCAACGASDAKKDCGRCKTTYCSAACQTQHWKEGGHKDLCRRIKRGGGAEQYHADKKYAVLSALAVETCTEATKGQTCYICRDERSTEGLVRGCACHTTEGFAHLSCLVREAQVVSEDQFRQHNRYSIWIKSAECGLCHQRYHGAVACAMGWACWNTYVSRSEENGLRGYALCAVSVGSHELGRAVEALCPATAYRDWCRRFDSANIIAADENLANVYAQLGRHDEALAILRRVHAAKVRTLGSEDHSSVLSLLNLSVTLEGPGRYGEVIELLREERPAACRALGENHQLCLSLAHDLGVAHLKRAADMEICSPLAPCFATLSCGPEKSTDPTTQTHTRVNSLS